MLLRDNNWHRNSRKNKLNTKGNFFKIKYSLVKRGVTSGGSRMSYFFKRELPLQIKYSNLFYSAKHWAGRNSSGRIVLRTRKSKPRKSHYPKVNYGFRLKNINFIGSILILPFSHRLLSLLFLSSGSVTYIPTTTGHALFTLGRLYGMLDKADRLKRKFDEFHKLAFIDPSFFLLYQLPRNKPICLLEITPGRGSQYVRSPGSVAKMSRKDHKLNTGLVKLPSGVRKIFSVFSTGSLGTTSLPETKLWKSNKAGYYSRFGRKPMVRGVAKNPIDHPHGGRTKTIHHPRTPWGKTTKIK